MKIIALIELVKAYAPDEVLQALQHIQNLENQVRTLNHQIGCGYRSVMENARFAQVERQGKRGNGKPVETQPETPEEEYIRWREAMMAQAPSSENPVVDAVIGHPPHEVHLIHEQTKLVTVLDYDKDAAEIERMRKDGWRDLQPSDYETK